MVRRSPALLSSRAGRLDHRHDAGPDRRRVESASATAVRGLVVTCGVYCVSFGVVNVVIKVLVVPAGATVEGSYCALGTTMAAGCA